MRFPRPVSRHWLRLRVHADGFAAAPSAYLTATKWWILGKRVRARGQFAPLLGRSRFAYPLWALENLDRELVNIPDRAGPPIIALVEGETGAVDPWLAATMASLAGEGVTAFVVSRQRPEELAAIAAQIDWSARPWIMTMRAGDTLTAGAARAYRAAIELGTAVVYADDDLCDRRGRFKDPHFKPGWNSELFRHCDFLTGASLINTQRAWLEQLAGLPDWAARLTALATAHGEVRHLPHVLHHRRKRPAFATQVEPLALADHWPRVTVIVPTRNRVDLLRTCIEGLQRTEYPDLEVLVVDNDSDDPETLAYLEALPSARIRVLRHTGPFNYSAINNRAVEQATGSLLCLLNNDIEILSPDWLRIMATQAQRAEVGAVGAQLLYPDGRIQHAGVVIGVGNAAGHAHRFLYPQDQGYFRRHAFPQFASAVTAACLVVARDKFLAVGGLNESRFTVAFNDVDLCLRLNQRGWQSFYEPRACLIHHESVSRGFDRDPVGAHRFAGELAALQELWKTDEIVDPFHHPRLSRASEQFTLAL